MRALVILHEPGCEPMLVGDRLGERGFELDPVMVATEAGDPAGYDLIVAMGSIRSVNEAPTTAWITAELDYLRRADEAEVPILGICFGAQALATSLGGRVVRAERAQIGWFPLVPDVECGLPNGPWMQWHYDRIDPPAGAQVLAQDDLCVQAFTIRRHLGLQFHPEVTRAHVARWIDDGGIDELDRLGIDPDELLGETEAITPDVTERTGRLVDWFLSDIAKL